jgi:hypothetical protein
LELQIAVSITLLYQQIHRHTGQIAAQNVYFHFVLKIYYCIVWNFDYYIVCMVYNNLPMTKTIGHMAAIAQENQQIGGDSRTRTLSHTHINITECSMK